jgi:hypothetical protein
MPLYKQYKEFDAKQLKGGVPSTKLCGVYGGGESREVGRGQPRCTDHVGRHDDLRLILPSFTASATPARMLACQLSMYPLR